MYAIETGRHRRKGRNIMNSNEVQAIFRDEFGVEAISLRWDDGEFQTVIRGVDCTVVWSFEEISLADEYRQKAAPSVFNLSAQGITLDAYGDLRHCRLTICFPLQIFTGIFSELIVHAEFPDESESRRYCDLRFEWWIDGVRVGVERGFDLDDTVARLFAGGVPEIKPQCCLSCAFSGYNPFVGGPLRCFQEVREAYSQTKTKADMYRLMGGPDTDAFPDVHQFHWCDQFQPRIPGTGNRG